MRVVCILGEKGKVMKKETVVFQSPLGWLEVSGNGKAVTGIRPCKLGEGGTQTSQDPVLVEAMEQLQEYFEGKRESFEVPVDPEGTEFQRKVWKALTFIPHGQCHSYQDIARSIGHNKACRAVGAAIGKNPVFILIPCHRVVGKDGRLTGFAWGLDRKQWLLNHECGKHPKYLFCPSPI